MRSYVIAIFTMCCVSLIHAQVPEVATDISPLLIGEQIPDVPVTQLDGSEATLLSLVEKKPSLVIFYRGGWCPFCNVHLAELQEIQQDILDRGYQIIAVSPDNVENLNKSIEKNSLSYVLISDSDLELTKAFGLAFNAPEKYRDMLQKQSGGSNPGVLPVPALFIIDQEGTILFEYINPNYKVRIGGEMLLGILDTLE
jgi:peroxiredoxin